MATFAPDVPESQEPNYLRYSRPQNFLEPNKAPGELFKAAGEVFTQGARGIDSTVKSGIDAYVGSKAEAISNQYIHGQLEPEYQRVTGHDPRQDPSGNLLSSYAEATPQEVKDLPQKMENLEAFKAKGGFVPTYYRAQLDATAKSVRSVFPGFSGYIDRSIAKATGGIEANAYAGQLLSGINAAESKIDNERKRQENMIDSLGKEGAIEKPIWDGYKQGKFSAEYVISRGIDNRHTKADVELSNARASLREKNNTLDKQQAEHDFDRIAVKGLSSSIQDMQAVNGAPDDASHMEMYRKYTSGQIRAPNPEQMLELEKTHQILRQKYVTQQMQANPQLLAEMGSETATKKAEHIGQLFDTYTGFIHNRDYENAFSYATAAKAQAEGFGERYRMSPLGQWNTWLRTVEKESPSWVGPYMASEVMNNPNYTTGLKGITSENILKAAAGPEPGKTAPSIHPTLNQLHEQGAPGDAKKIMLDLPLKITDPKVSDETARNLVDFGFAGDGAKIWPQLAAETYNKKGNVSVWEQYTNPQFAAKVKSLGEGAWQTYIGSMGEGAHHIIGKEIQDLNSVGDRYKVSYDSDNAKIKLTPKGNEYPAEAPSESGFGHAFRSVVSALKYRSFDPDQAAVDRVNRVLQGWSNIAKQDPSINVNAEVLKILQSEGLKDGPVTRQILQAIQASHKSAAPAPQGQTMNDAGDQMGMGATAMNMMPKDPMFGVPLGETLPAIRPGVGTTTQGFVAPGKGSTNIQVPPELGRGGGDYLGKGGMSTIERTPIQPDVTMTPALARSQKVLDKTLARGQADAARATQAGQASVDKESAKAAEMHKRSQENIDALSHSTSQLMEKFKGHGREEEFLGNRLEGLKRTLSNYGEGPAKKGLQSEIRMVQKRLKEIKLEQNPMSEPIYKAP